MRKSISKKLKTTKSKKTIHRVPGQGHSKTNKGAVELMRKKNYRSLNFKARVLRKLG